MTQLFLNKNWEKFNRNPTLYSHNFKGLKMLHAFSQGSPSDLELPLLIDLKSRTFSPEVGKVV